MILPGEWIMKVPSLEDTKITSSIIRMKLLILERLKARTNTFITGKKLGDEVGVGPESIRRFVHILRKEGEPIASNVAKGYAYVTDRKVLEETADWFEAKARDHLHTAKILRNILQDKSKWTLFDDNHR